MRSAVLLVAAVTLLGCSDPPKNPDKVWLWLLGSEIEVQLIANEPAPF